MSTKERKKYEHISIDGAGNAKKVQPKLKDWSYRTKGQGRAKNVMPTRAKVIKFEEVIWDAKTLCNFFRTAGIHSMWTEWKITFYKITSSLTAEQQLNIFLAHTDVNYFIKINRAKKLLHIEQLQEHPEG